MVESGNKQAQVEEVKRKVVDADAKKKVMEVEKGNINARIKQKMNSPFISQSKQWDNKEHFDIPSDIIKGLKEELWWEQPSRIQGVAIPYIVTVD